MKGAAYQVAVAAATMGLALAAGCGLKGPLTMPERSSNIVIRGPTGEVVDGAAAPAPPAAGEAPVSTTTPAPASPAGDAPAPSSPAPPAGTPPAAKKPAADPDRMPPPPLPGGNQGSTLGD